jgi:hypothetical protein
MRCRLFIDEVGNGDLQGSATIDNERYLSLTGIITRLDLYQKKFIPEVAAFKTDIFGPEIGSSVILHRREITRKEGVFSILRDPEVCAKFDDGLLRLFKELPYMASTIVIDKREHLKTYGVWHFDPYHYCLTAMIERYVLWMNRHKYTGDVTVEPRNQKPDRKLKKSFLGIHQKGTGNIPAALIQQRLTSKDIKFTPKIANCPAMQICDLLAYPSFKGMKYERIGQEQPQDYGTKILDILEKWKYARNPNTLSRIGWGKKWLP